MAEDTDQNVNRTDPAHALPAGLPMARPLTVESVGTILLDRYWAPRLSSPAWPPTMSRLRAVMELIILVPAGLAGIAVVEIIVAILQPDDERWFNLCSSLGMGLGALVACAFILRIGRQRASSIGLTRRRLATNIGLGILAWPAIYAVIWVSVISLSLFYPSLIDQTNMAQKAIEEVLPPLGTGGIALTMIFVVLWEETIFRGFLLTRLYAILKRWWLAIPAGAVIFGMVHGYQGFLAMILVTCLGLSMSVLFVWRRSLIPSLILHWLHNVGTLLALRLISSTWQ